MNISVSLNIAFICVALLLQDEGTEEEFSQDEVLFRLISPHNPELFSTPVSIQQRGTSLAITNTE